MQYNEQHNRCIHRLYRLSYLTHSPVAPGFIYNIRVTAISIIGVANLETLGERLKQARKNKRYSQVYVCEATGINNKTISSYERNNSKPDIETLAKLSELYEVSLDYLITGKKPTKAEIPIELREFIQRPDTTLDGIPLTDKQRIEINAALTLLTWKSNNNTR